MPQSLQITIGNLTPEQTAELVQEGIGTLDEETLFRVLNAALTADQKAELAASWEPED